ncbi:MAG: arginine repressor [Actinomycetota bacterium]|nr:arginine repressor [Actinomycetota bacterium]
MKRDARLKAIKEIILSRKVSSQEQLQEELKERGFSVTQATVSRDINFLRLVKVRNYRQQEFYTLGRRYKDESPFNMEKLRIKFKESVITINRAYNTLVLNTYPGDAQGVAAIIDGMNFLEVLGTVAGDDTIICVVDTIDNAEKIEKLLNDF